MARRTVATLPRARKQEVQVLRTTRPCKRCRKQFWPIRKDQLFCPGGDCRRAWWREHRKTEPHNCRCGKGCNPPKKRAPRRKECAEAKALRSVARDVMEMHRRACKECGKEA